ncbi:MAG TPA: methionyl-tRNA formyltransferase [Candidatus Saccharimonadales bacterium]|nr:methionyl-tRNA formyltransferase [Candidatus Saccharimonadales bacterium]
MKKSLVFFGTEDFSAPSLRSLIEDGWPIIAVVTRPDSRRGRGQLLSEPAVKKLALEHGLAVLQPKTKQDILAELPEAEAGVLVAYGQIVPQEVIDHFAKGIINLHPSLLPKYRGPAPIEAAILNGDKETGLSLMALSSEMDAGPVFVQEELELTGAETQPQLYERLADLGASLLAKNLPLILTGQLKPKQQDDAAASYTKLVAKQDGLLDTSRPAEELERKVRAFASWPRCRISIGSQEVVVTKARVAAGPTDGELILECSPGYLEILELIVPGRKPVSGKQFLGR